MRATAVHVRRLIASAVCLALAMVLPLLTGQLEQLGSALCPMHIPVILCGFICGWPWGLAVGFIAPLLRFLIFGMPVIFPKGVAMAFELAAYGALAGLLYSRLPKKTSCLYGALIAAMVGGRALWGLVQYLLAGLQDTAFPLSAFLAGAVTNAIPGIILQLILIPLLVLALKKAGIHYNE